MAERVAVLETEMRETRDSLTAFTDAVKAFTAAVTALSNKSIYDPYTNLLRATAGTGAGRYGEVTFRASGGGRATTRAGR